MSAPIHSLVILLITDFYWDQYMKRTSTKGFTLIEAMVVLAIIAIIISIAWPMYENHTRKNIRSQAVKMLSLLRQEMQRCASNNNGNFANCANTYANFVQPIINRQYADIYYNVATNINVVNGVAGAGYTLIATEITGNDPDCLTLSIDELGNKGFTEVPGSNSNLIRCWGSN